MEFLHDARAGRDKFHAGILLIEKEKLTRKDAIAFFNADRRLHADIIAAGDRDVPYVFILRDAVLIGSSCEPQIKTLSNVDRFHRGYPCDRN